MDDLLDEMQHCKSLEECVELACLDAHGEYEQAAAWQACLETLFDGVQQVRVLGEDATLEGFDLVNDLSVVAICRRHGAPAKVAPESVEFLKMTPAQRLWMRAWRKWSRA